MPYLSISNSRRRSASNVVCSSLKSSLEVSDVIIRGIVATVEWRADIIHNARVNAVREVRDVRGSSDVRGMMIDQWGSMLMFYWCI